MNLEKGTNFVENLQNFLEELSKHVGSTQMMTQTWRGDIYIDG